MSQRTFFDDEFQQDMESKKLSRRSDPESSRLAARKVPVSALQELTLNILRESPGLTGQELRAKSGKDLHKRLREMQRIGLVREGEMRTCSVTGNKALTWWVVQ